MKNTAPLQIKSCEKHRHRRVNYVLPWVAKSDRLDLRSSNGPATSFTGRSSRDVIERHWELSVY